MTELFNQVYGKESPNLQAVDVFLPDPEGANGAAVFFVHGGGFSGGGRHQWHAVARHFTGLGYVCASAGYRLMPDCVFPVQVEDARTAMSWFKDRHAEFGFDPDRVAAWGSSAGGYLVAMLGVTDSDAPLGRTPGMRIHDTRPAALVCLCTVFSLHRDGGYYKPVFLGCEEEANPEIYTTASPIDHVSARTPPVLMVTGDADKTTPVIWHTTMLDALRSHGVAAELAILPGVTHGYGYGVTTDAQKTTIGYAERFLQRVLARLG